MEVKDEKIITKDMVPRNNNKEIYSPVQTTASARNSMCKYRPTSVMSDKVFYCSNGVPIIEIYNISCPAYSNIQKYTIYVVPILIIYNIWGHCSKQYTINGVLVLRNRQVTECIARCKHR